MTDAASLHSPDENRERTIKWMGRELLDVDRINASDNYFSKYFTDYRNTKRQEFITKAIELYKAMPGNADKPIPELNPNNPNADSEFFSQPIAWQDESGKSHRTTMGQYIESHINEAELLERKRVFEKFAEAIRNEDPPDFATTVKDGVNEAVSGITDGLMQGDFNILGHIFSGIKHIVTGVVMNIPFIGKPVRQAGTALAMVFTDYDRISKVFNGNGTFSEHVGTFWNMAGQRAQSNDMGQRAFRDAGDGLIQKPILLDMIRHVNERQLSSDEMKILDSSNIKNILAFLGDKGGETAKLYLHDPGKDKFGKSPLLTQNVQDVTTDKKSPTPVSSEGVNIITSPVVDAINKGSDALAGTFQWAESYFHPSAPPSTPAPTRADSPQTIAPPAP